MKMFTAQVDLCKELKSSLDSSTLHDRDLIIDGALSKGWEALQRLCLPCALMTTPKVDPVTLLTCWQILLTAKQVDLATTTLVKMDPDWKYRWGFSPPWSSCTWPSLGC